jgi:hypothetical protein
MKIRNGFVSNSSSGSFIFPKGMNVKEVERILTKITELGKEINPNVRGGIQIGLRSPRIIKKGADVLRFMQNEYCSSYKPKINEDDYIGRVVAYTVGDNTVPYWIHQILESELVNADYVHFG